MDVHYVNRYLDTNGDGSGTKDAVGNYSSTPETFYITPDVDYDIVLTRMLVTIRDAGVIDAEGYGAAPALTNGIQVYKRDVAGGIAIDLLDGLPIKTNADWGRVCFDVSEVAFGTGDNYAQARWTFAKAGVPLLLKEGERLSIELSDSFIALTGHWFIVQGYAMDNEYQSLGRPIRSPT